MSALGLARLDENDQTCNRTVTYQRLVLRFEYPRRIIKYLAHFHPPLDAHICCLLEGTQVLSLDLHSKRFGE